MKAIEIKNLKKYFGKTKAVDDISFDIEKGEVFGFLGPNGAGKTTTIRCMMDFIFPESGSISILDKDSRKDSVELKKKIGYLSASESLYSHWTGNDHIQFLEQLNKNSSTAKKLAQDFDLDLNKKTKNLSFGNKQKLALILALMHKPEILILDEPTVGLDPLLQNLIYKILQEYRDQGTTIFMSSHNLPEVEKICDRVAIIKNGKIVAIENIKSIQEKWLRTINIHFNEKYNEKDFELKGIKILSQNEKHISFTAKGDVNEIINKIAKYKIKDIEITHASLEEIFMEFYERN